MELFKKKSLFNNINTNFVDVKKQSVLNLFVYASNKVNIVKINVFAKNAKIKLLLKLSELKIFKKCINNVHVLYLIIFNTLIIKIKKFLSTHLVVNVKRHNVKKIFVYVIKQRYSVHNCVIV